MTHNMRNTGVLHFQFYNSFFCNVSVFPDVEEQDESWLISDKDRKVTCDILFFLLI